MSWIESSAPAGAAGVFRVRLECGDAEHEQRLSDFLRRNGHFAYPVSAGLETVCVGTASAALRELLGDVLRWWDSEPDAALTAELSAGSIAGDGAAVDLSQASISTPSASGVPGSETPANAAVVL